MHTSGTNDALVDSVVKIIADAIQPDKIILFGSKAKGTARQNSDIDLLIIKDTTASKRDLKLSIRRLFSRQNFSMDLFVLTPEEFRRQQGVANTIARTAAREGGFVMDDWSKFRLKKRKKP